ncbi:MULTISPECIES: hypothetical protein [unclassified Pseudomonas]|uniref:hypothetical protein n=1 Tax=unclassified Pseudomonas TaxID=196821 RepID=UPI002AC8AD3B|nr:MULTISPECIES: hypothetical protein [unclassified Pseudomonas]MEB0046415.1 hypothetical protein [Pseudomonas sp. Dout3]MEB0099325.1 hypothetical protein [Pseudomonas sp. DC1.2]WPX59471.1 hypothetical protein RHM68_02120 [Pseudomonas sp. DC1.2]
MRATWNPYTSLTHIYWLCGSCVVSFAMLGMIFFPYGALGRYVAGWPIGMSILMSIVLSVISSFSKRDHKVSISVVPQGLMFRDEAVGYKRQELILREEIHSIHVRRNPFFKSLVIELKEDNQRFFLSNAAFTDGFFDQVRAHIKYEC